MEPAGPGADGTEGRLVYAVGDVHGRADLLDRLAAAIRADAAATAPGARPLVIFLGDYVDRGPDSAGVLDRLLALAADPALDLEALRGNHEAALLAFLNDAEAGPEWSAWGGDATLRSYGIAAPSPLAAASGWKDARARFAAALPPAHLAFLRALPFGLELGDYLFVHAGVDPHRPLDRQRAHDLLMIREPFLSWPEPLARVVVHGHTPAAEPFASAVRIGVDTGAYATGVLTAVRLHDRDRRFLAAGAT